MLASFGYAQLAFAALIGWLLFRHAPDFAARVGMALIVASGALTVWLNGREAARHVAPPALATDPADVRRPS